jgi:hypothetical protein
MPPTSRSHSAHHGHDADWNITSSPAWARAAAGTADSAVAVSNTAACAARLDLTAPVDILQILHERTYFNCR